MELKILNTREFVLSCIIIVLLIFGYGLYRDISTIRNEKATLETNIKIAQDTVNHFKDKHGQVVSEKGVMVIKVGELKNQANMLGVDNKRLKDQVGNLNRLVSYWQGEAQTKGTIDTVYKDSIIYVDNKPVLEKKLDWNNKYLFLNQTYYPETNKLNIDYKYQTGIEFTVYNKPTGLFKKSELVGDARFSDHNMILDKSQIILIDKTREKRFYETTLFKIGIGVVGGYLITK